MCSVHCSQAQPRSETAGDLPRLQCTLLPTHALTLLLLTRRASECAVYTAHKPTPPKNCSIFLPSAVCAVGEEDVCASPFGGVGRVAVAAGVRGP